MLVNKLPELVKKYQDEQEAKTKKKPTEAEIAKLAGVDKTTFSRYKNGLIGSVDFEVWQRLANFFKVKGSAIFDLLPESENE